LHSRFKTNKNGATDNAVANVYFFEFGNGRQRRNVAQIKAVASVNAQTQASRSA
jgi:hypothetical protein